MYDRVLPCISMYVYPCTTVTVYARVSLRNYHPCITTFYCVCLCIAMYYCVYTHVLPCAVCPSMYLAIDSEGMSARGIIIVLVLIIQLVGQKNIETKHLSIVKARLQSLFSAKTLQIWQALSTTSGP